MEPLAEFQSPSPCTAAALAPGSTTRHTHQHTAAGSPATRAASPAGSAGAGGWSPPRDASLSDVCVVGGFADGALRLFSVSGDQLTSVWHCARHTSPVLSVITHPNGQSVLTASADGSMAVTELRTSRLTVYLEHFVSGSKQQALHLPEVAAAAAAAPAGAGELCGVDCSEADASVCVAAWRTHMLVFGTPWDDCVVRMLAMYRCEPVSALHAVSLMPPLSHADTLTLRRTQGAQRLANHFLTRVVAERKARTEHSVCVCACVFVQSAGVHSKDVPAVARFVPHSQKVLNTSHAHTTLY